MDALDREFNEMCNGVGIVILGTRYSPGDGLMAAVERAATPSRAEYEAFLATRQLQWTPYQAHPADVVEAARRDQLQAQEAERRRAAGLPS